MKPPLQHLNLKLASPSSTAAAGPELGHAQDNYPIVINRSVRKHCKKDETDGVIYKTIQAVDSSGVFSFTCHLCILALTSFSPPIQQLIPGVLFPRLRVQDVMGTSHPDVPKLKVYEMSPFSELLLLERSLKREMTCFLSNPCGSEMSSKSFAACLRCARMLFL